MGASPRGDEGPIGRVSSRLGRLDAGIRASARRSRRISWFSWGFLFVVVIVPFTLILPLIVPLFGGVFVWAAIGAIPAIALLGLVVRELWVGSGEAVRVRDGERVPPSPDAREPAPIGPSLRTVQDSQKRISQVKSELEISMIPLALGLAQILLTGAFLVFEVWLDFNLANAPVWWILLPPLGGLAVLAVVMWVLWGLAKLWIAQYQEGLDQQVLAMISLEGEFFGRFASGPTGS